MAMEVTKLSCVFRLTSARRVELLSNAPRSAGIGQRESGSLADVARELAAANEAGLDIKNGLLPRAVRSMHEQQAETSK